MSKGLGAIPYEITKDCEAAKERHKEALVVNACRVGKVRALVTAALVIGVVSTMQRAEMRPEAPLLSRRKFPGGSYLDGKTDVVVFDCETTGTGRGDRIVSLGALRLTPTLEVIDAIHFVFNPGR